MCIFYKQDNESTRNSSLLNIILSTAVFTKFLCFDLLLNLFDKILNKSFDSAIDVGFWIRLFFVWLKQKVRLNHSHSSNKICQKACL